MSVKKQNLCFWRQKYMAFLLACLILTMKTGQFTKIIYCYAKMCQVCNWLFAKECYIYSVLLNLQVHGRLLPTTHFLTTNHTKKHENFYRVAASTDEMARGLKSGAAVPVVMP
jgi:hypothetical protein